MKKVAYPDLIELWSKDWQDSRSKGLERKQAELPNQILNKNTQNKK